MIKPIISRPRYTIITGIIFVLFMLFVLPYVASISETRTHTAFSPDTKVLYTPATFYDAMALYGESGRQFYIIMRWTFDLIWPLVYTSFFISVIGYLSNKVWNHLSYIALGLPVLAVAFDLLENILATINVGIYPERSLFLLRLLQGATALKWVLIGLTILFILVLSIQLLVRRLKQS